MLPSAVVASVLAFALSGCVGPRTPTSSINRWSVEPSPVEDADIAAILQQLPSALECIERNKPALCGVDPGDYLVGHIGEEQRQALFPDGPLVIQFERWSDDDSVAVIFAGGRARGAAGVMHFVRKGHVFVLTGVYQLIYD